LDLYLERGWDAELVALEPEDGGRFVNELALFRKGKEEQVVHSAIEPWRDCSALTGFSISPEAEAEFDYIFVGYTGAAGSPDALSVTAVNLTSSSAQPQLPVIFDVRPSTQSSFYHATIDLRPVETWRAFVSFTFLASSADVKRKKLEGFYLDNFG
jgi:hypothetical protein